MTDQLQELLTVELRKRGDPISLEAAAEIERLNAALEIMGPKAVNGVRTDEPQGWKLAMEVLQSDLYRALPDDARAECDAILRERTEQVRQRATQLRPTVLSQGRQSDPLDRTVLCDKLAAMLRDAPCPTPGCVDGSIRNTGPDPQDDACPWCYARHDLISLTTYGRESENVELPPGSAS